MGTPVLTHSLKRLSTHCGTAIEKIKLHFYNELYLFESHYPMKIITALCINRSGLWQLKTYLSGTMGQGTQSPCGVKQSQKHNEELKPLLSPLSSSSTQLPEKICSSFGSRRQPAVSDRLKIFILSFRSQCVGWRFHVSKWCNYEYEYEFVL